MNTNEISSASLASNQISLPAGTYFCIAWAGWYNSANSNIASKLRIRNVTDSTNLILGTSLFAGAASSAGDAMMATLGGRFTLAGTKTLELQHYAQGAANGGVGMSGAGVSEVHASVMIWKI